MTEPLELDPDEVSCRKCGADAGEVCRQPNGDRARTVHAVRRTDAANGGAPARPASNPRARKIRDKARGSSTFDSTSAKDAAKRSAQERRRRRAEAAAQVEAKREAAERAAIEEEAEKLAKDAVRYDRDRAILRRHVLDAASLSYERLLEGLRGLQRVDVDDDGRPIMRAEEYEDRNGRTRTRQVADVRGAYPASVVERLSKIAAQGLISLRLEEDKPTGITRQDSGERAADILGRAGVEELLAWASENLDPPA